MSGNNESLSAALLLLREELDLWREAGAVADFWWRDDDASRPCAALERLLELARTHHAPCGLATIPARVVPELAEALRGSPCEVLVHGYAHVNHAPKGQGGWEFGAHRDEQTMLAELRRGREWLADLFASRFVPGFVPPWNKIAPEAARLLPRAGLCGLSCTWKKANPEFPGVVRADAHGDVLHWKAKVALFAGAERVVGELLDHLRFRRGQGFALKWTAPSPGLRGADAPTCVLTHHLEMDGESWRFMDALLRLVNEHPASRWVAPSVFWTCGEGA